VYTWFATLSSLVAVATVGGGVVEEMPHQLHSLDARYSVRPMTAWPEFS